VIKIEGDYNHANIYTDKVEESAYKQIQELCNMECFENSKIRIMPDVHAGAGCTIGTTMTITDKVIPDMVGVDIGCGMRAVKLNRVTYIGLEKFDKHIHETIPSGFSVHETRKALCKDIYDLRCYAQLKNENERFERAIGTLGGGNHFIEIDKDSKDNLYLVIHSGSRNLGLQVAAYYQKKTSEYQSYLEGQLFDDYIHDMEIAQFYAQSNRDMIQRLILDYFDLGDVECHMLLKDFETFEVVHNYIDTKNMILRKGAISAQAGEKVLIPINMKDGCILGTGKGSADWNFSAPHGAGRTMSRTEARKTLKMQDFETAMNGVYSTSVSEATIDEAPMAYKSIDEILENIKDTVEVTEILKPIYNFKAGKE
jgi:RNA-splicing ligase RtcB